MLRISVFTLIMSWLFPYNKKAKQLIQLLGFINGTPDRNTQYKNILIPLSINTTDIQYYKTNIRFIHFLFVVYFFTFVVYFVV